MQILDKRQETLVIRERALLESLIDFLDGFGAPSNDLDLIRRTLADMEDPFLLVVVGEFNAGKSAFINALLGEEAAPEGSLPTTDRITVLKHSPELSLQEGRDGILEKGYPSDFLRGIAVVDTPGTNAVIREHEELSRDFVPRSDLVLFVTSADRPFSESERDYMELIRDWGKKVVLIVNKSDVLKPDEVDKMRRFVEEQVRTLLGLTPPVFMVSSRVGQQAKQVTTEPEHGDLLRESGFDKLEAHVFDQMGTEDRVRLKLRSPLGVVEELVRRYQLAAEERTRLLEDDLELVRNVDSLLGSYQEDTRRDFEVRMAQLSVVVNEINERGDAWFEENSGLRTSLFGRRDNLQERFRQEVVAGTGEVVDKRVQELINWLIYRNMKQWRTVVDYVELHRKAAQKNPVAGQQLADNFDQRRDELLGGIRDQATSEAQTRDYRREADRLANALRDAVTRTAVSEATALGLGDAANELASNETMDITGTTLALLVSGLELAARPGRKAREEFRTQTRAMRERLGEAVEKQLEEELEQSVRQMRGTLTPYTNFVNSEITRMKVAKAILGKVGEGSRSLRDAIYAPDEEPEPFS